MAKIAKFVNQVSSDHGKNKDTDRRVELEESPVPVPETQAEESTLDILYAFIAKRTEDELHQDYGFHRIHVNMIAEMGERKSKGKPVVLSDGNIEMLKINYDRLKKKNLI